MKSSRQRDESIERCLRQLPPPAGADSTEACLDAEDAAAWVAGRLSGEPLAGVHAHVADCGRCQMLVGALVRAEAGGGDVEPAPARRRWLGWLVPLTATATVGIALAVWVTLPRQTDLAKQSSIPAPPPEPTAQADERASASVPAVAPAPPAEVRESASASTSAAPANQEIAAASARAGAAPLAVGLARRVEPAAEMALAAAGWLVVVSPDPSVRWRFVASPAQTVQRSRNQGVTWEDVAVGGTATFLAGSSPSPSVCWLVGRGGVIVSIEGVDLRRLAFPEPTDLTAVQAIDARTALVTTRDGRTFRTADGGGTWTQP